MRVDRWHALPSTLYELDDAPKVRFSATVGEGPEVELALV